MLEQEKRERVEGGVLGLNGYFWEERQFCSVSYSYTETPQPYYYFPLCGQLALQELPVVSGSLLSEEMGLGKTVEVISLLLAAPPAQELLDQEALIIQRMQEAEETKRVAKVDREDAKAAERKRKRESDADEDNEAHLTSFRKVPPSNLKSSGASGVRLTRSERAKAREAMSTSALLDDDDDDLGMHLAVVSAAAEKCRGTPLSKAAKRDYIPQCKATLIIVPVSLLLQWTKELAAKAPSLRVTLLGDRAHSVKVMLGNMMPVM
jgi:SNF2 family DNA or RNA helicase